MSGFVIFSEYMYMHYHNLRIVRFFYNLSLNRSSFELERYVLFPRNWFLTICTTSNFKMLSSVVNFYLFCLWYDRNNQTALKIRIKQALTHRDNLENVMYFLSKLCSKIIIFCNFREKIEPYNGNVFTVWVIMFCVA